MKLTTEVASKQKVPISVEKSWGLQKNHTVHTNQLPKILFVCLHATGLHVLMRENTEPYCEKNQGN
jgi:hypothetical protein